MAMEVKRIDYKTVEFGGSIVKMPIRIKDIVIYKKFIILRLMQKEGDKEYDIYIETGNRFGGKHYEKQGNVFCYDARGVLVWQWHEKGITGMRLVDQEYIEEQRGSINRSRETLLEKGYSKDKIVAKDYVNPLLHPEGQIILCHAGPSYDSLVDIPTGKELDRWETR